MKRTLIFALLPALLLVGGLAETAKAGHPRMRQRAYQYAQMSPWHGNYYHSAWGMPVALVVPPTAEFETHWGWGVGGTRITTIYHQFGRDCPGPGEYQRSMFSPTPPWPRSTDQFGVYYVRGPW